MVPSILETADGWVGFTLVTSLQIQDFFTMIGCPEWAADPTLHHAGNRSARAVELLPVIEEWMRSRSTEDVVELSSLFRLPGVRIERPDTVVAVPQFVESGFFVEHPDGSFVQPATPYRIHGRPPTSLRPSPPLDPDAVDAPWPTDPAVPSPAPRPAPDGEAAVPPPVVGPDGHAGAGRSGGRRGAGRVGAPP
jgi:crotonobetainyl-CoA:carnitine CoA-transferase CaiB-like acyl-CoA transferase